jgi:hypothetical protein
MGAKYRSRSRDMVDRTILVAWKSCPAETKRPFGATMKIVMDAHLMSSQFA